ncbi:TauD/TfdA family dioxygenase [Burkholderia gladioli]|uniref:TauD/TfdA family dioxygenase n=1 Tax=Burkholderia gladioli TaxID=28095 RepID=UPI0022DB2580|nr:TauD/TfdA family dioxygenase [Burkholderia gladioli]MDA0574078.1 TauD/TfdA family dioxygenase [Burkholderia gladioli]MDA0602353.1 TauD/TfdA family dioxygenase [Burkholderia gladioli]
MNLIHVIDCANLDASTIELEVRHAVEQLRPALTKLVNLPMNPVSQSTPSHWKHACETPNDTIFLEISSMFGDVFGYSDLQGGRLVQEIFPIRDDAYKQVGSGAVKLELHTEDPALDYRADYLGFMCVSNIDRIPTTVSVPDLSRLTPSALDCLINEPFRILSDRPSSDDHKNQDLVTPILFQDARQRGRIIYDPVYICYDSMRAGQRAAFAELQALVEDATFDFLLLPGEIGVIDNYQVAHGRPRYQPRYDGTDRWLKRTQISKDFQRHSHLAAMPARVLP